MSSGFRRGPIVETSIHVHTAAGDYTIVDEAILVVNKASGAATAATLPAGAAHGQSARMIYVKDGKGDAATNNITVTAAGSDTIDGAATYVIADNYGFVMLSWNGTEWNVIDAGVGRSSGATTAASITSSGKIVSTSPTAGVGYATGAGGAVTQITSSSTGVALSKTTGQITTVALTTAAAAEERFTVTNAEVAVTDVIALSTTYNGAGTPMLGVCNVTAGTFDIVITNLHASAAFNAVMVINFVVIKGVAT